MNHIPLFLAVCLLVLASCGKEDVTRAELLAGTNAKVWTLSARSNNGTPELLNDCEKSFELTFKNDGTWNSLFTDSECVPEERNGGWSFDAAETVLTITESGQADETWEVVELSAASFVHNREFLGVDQVVSYIAQ